MSIYNNSEIIYNNNIYGLSEEDSSSIPSSSGPSSSGPSSEPVDYNPDIKIHKITSTNAYIKIPNDIPNGVIIQLMFSEIKNQDGEVLTEISSYGSDLNFNTLGKILIPGNRYYIKWKVK